MAESKASEDAHVKKLDLEFIKCPICLEEMQDPKSLPCMHIFCKSCLGIYIEKQQADADVETKLSAFPCPVCRKDTLPVDPTADIKLWAEHYESNSLVVTFEKQKTMQSCEKNCSPCQVRMKQKRPADIWCKNCNIFICADCRGLHDLFESGHSLCTIEEFTEDPFIAIHQSSKCEKHGETLSYVCVSHDVIACTLCITIEHRQCENVISVKERCQEIRQNKNLELLLEKYDVALVDMNGLIEITKKRFDSLDGEKASVEDEVEREIEETKNQLAKLHEIFLDSLSAAYKEEKEKNSMKLKRCEQLKLAIERSRRILETNQRYGDETSVIRVNSKGEAEFDFYEKNIAMEYRNKALSHLSASLSSELRNIKAAAGIAEVQKGSGNYDYELPNAVDWFSCDLTVQLLKSFDGKVENDANDCYFTDLIFIQQNRLAAVDHSNQKLKLFTVNGECVSHFLLPHKPWGVCEMEPGCLATSYCQDQQISIFIIQDDQFTIKKTINLNCQPYGIIFKDQSFIVSLGSTDSCIQCYSTDGTHLYTTTALEDVKYLFKMPRSGYLVASKDNTRQGDILLQLHEDTKLDTKTTMLLSEMSQYSVAYGWNRQTVYQMKPGSYQGGCGMTSDGHDNIYVCFRTSHHVAMVTKDSAKKTLLSEADGINCPCAITMQRNKFVVAEENQNILKVFRIT